MRSHPIPIPRGASRPRAALRPQSASARADGGDWVPLAMLGAIAVPVSLTVLMLLGRWLGAEAAWPACYEQPGACAFSAEDGPERAAAP